ncbi:pilus assembly protein [Salmonella enterica subsp. diarizonae]|uniref:tyrosine-type DNA invertase n=1 Tax=Salmonella enterica TaxID=28901 RepID=UPI0009AEE10C|nr:tyrosine-type DNA invertase [Salmonella enterica]EAW2451773.1 pilus assembly protein [Salmonella enterica subsp. diarizonae]EHG2955309.1 tyrosine-type recombinase/integrase [Salmonella enterica subsp. diarizonae serovar 53:r:z35]EHG6069900.1 tyrosine-type recombinase/integrase [Salmonella enterica subsp. diarizonae serovar 61:z52:z53]ECI5214841.1 pilus assembly protein [Salmonella enterica subsp. diarizonae]EDL8432144.1 pilus assembly protein [Salmonella enterica subsp. diarizonae]
MQKRKFLTHHEVNLLLQTVKDGSDSARNCCMILLAYVHGLRVSELLSLQISDLELATKKIYIQRIKNGFSTVHPLQKEEVFVITKWLHERNSMNVEYLDNNPWLFISRTGKPLSRQRFYNILAAAGENAGLDIKVHPHMLRHACGYSLADNGVDTRLIQDYLGHRNIRHTVVYTASNSMRFEKIWRYRKTKKLHFDPKCKPSFLCE